jgi:hypothetical protein
LLPATLPRLLAKSAVPFAAINKDKTSYADSLLLKLDACCPATIAVGERSDAYVQDDRTGAPELAGGAAGKIALQQHREPAYASAEVFVRQVHPNADSVHLCTHLRRPSSPKQQQASWVPWE